MFHFLLQKTVFSLDIDCPLAITPIGETLFQTRPDFFLHLWLTLTLSIATRQEIKFEGDIIMGSSLKFCHNGFIDIKH